MKTFLTVLACAATLLLPACKDELPARMPRGEYKVSGPALEDIRGIYDAATHREGFRLEDEHLAPFERYLFHADSLPQEELNSLLFRACRYNCPDLVAELIARGANVNHCKPYWDMLDGDAEKESTRFGLRTALHSAALPCSYKGGATAEKAIRIIDLLLAAGAAPELGDSPLPYIALMEHDHVHFEEVFLHLLDCGYSLDEERVTPEPTDAHRAFAEKHGTTLDKARITPKHRAQVFCYLKELREMGYPWERVEKRLGMKPVK